MKKLKINFVDFYYDFDKKDNIFWDVLSSKYDLEISEDPDLLFYSVYTLEHYKYDCIKILYTAEDVRPNFKKCDFAITFDYNDDPRHYRMPLYVQYYYKYLKSGRVLSINKFKEKFCNFIYTNPYCKERNRFFKLLNTYKKVDSGGRHLNNIGYTIADKMAFIDQYKFTIAFENASSKGYTTEKIIEPFLVGSIPIYWGNPLVGNDFNPDSFVNVHDFNSFEEAIERVLEIDRDEVLYEKYRNEPIFKDGVLPDCFSKDKLLEFIEHALSQVGSKKLVSKSRFYFFYQFSDRIEKKIITMKGSYRYYKKRLRQIWN